MHIYNWYHSNVTGIHYAHKYRLQYTWSIPLAFYLPLLIPFCSPFWPLFTYLETLLAVTGSVHLSLRLLVNWPPLSQPFPQSLPPPNSQNPGYQVPHYYDLKNPASSVRNNYYIIMDMDIGRFFIQMFVDIFSTSRRFVPFDVLSHSAFFLFNVFSIRCFLLFYVLSHSVFFPFDLLSHSAFFPFDVLSHSAFCLSTFCRSTFLLSVFVPSTFF